MNLEWVDWVMYGGLVFVFVGLPLFGGLLDGLRAWRAPRERVVATTYANVAQRRLGAKLYGTVEDAYERKLYADEQAAGLVMPPLPPREGS